MDKLDIFIGEFREYRIDDREWKEDINDRLRGVEVFVTSRRAVNERKAARGVSRRAYVAATIAALGVGVSLVLGFVNAVT